ncbi:glycosyltransferase involved in cell wall biosynthesis [Pseudoduganella flava]|uniref:Glycosyltransferase n=1 Tax=Pseudoduganella flava TaxID=871742 RepID=A0A562PVD6_9BURK|nr:glycosyltransferase family 4 protein [Pseudoduganella flava]QGZ39515.1 glycosyltransferase [Pseudoduganella flava]TWI48405.1 glycosyltransferase involved in cell wall biosynthesis [Pseudoduganella flava]
MIHFFPTYTKDGTRSPFALGLKELGVDYRLFADDVRFRYHSRLKLLFVGWPKLAWFALRAGIRSLITSRTHPQAVVLGSDIEVLIFAPLRALFSRRTQIVLLGFILTPRRNALANRLRLAYFRFVMSFVDKVICHSKTERERYRELFANGRTEVHYIPHGTHIHGREETTQAAASPYILTAGRSGRDYGTLFEAVAPLPIRLHVVCDNDQPLSGLTIPPNVTVLRDCYDGDYVEQLKNARFVVVPLGVADISAGQMVLLQAMAFNKATVITRTKTVEDYVSDGVEALLVPQGDAAALRAAIVRLLDDAPLLAQMASRATDAFDSRFCMKAFVRNLVQAIDADAVKPNGGSRGQ